MRVNTNSRKSARRKARVAWLAILAAPFCLSGVVEAQTTLPVCPASITQCCQITSSAQYTLGANLTETASQDCIDVVASHVVLLTKGFSMSGNASDIGLHVLANANHFYWAGGGATVTTFNVAIQNDSSNVVIQELNLPENNYGVINNGVKATYASIIQSNGTFGLVNNAAAGLTVTQSTFSGNVKQGIQLNITSSALIENVQSNQNAGSGIKVVGGGSNSFVDITTDTNSLYGIWIKESAQNSFVKITADSNLGTGIYFGCSTSGSPNGTQ